MNTTNQKWYIGSTTKTLEERRKQHEWKAFNNTSDTYFYSALRKYGLESFEWSVLNTTDNIEELYDLELQYCLSLDTFAPNGYNTAIPGPAPMYGRNHTPKSRKKSSDSQQKKGPFGFSGIFIVSGSDPEKDGNCNCFGARIWYKGHRQYLETYPDPVSAEIVYNLVKEEIYGREKRLDDE